jgi:hypothetical protein
MISKLLKESLAMAMIGEGLLTLAFPRQHLMVWDTGPRAMRDLTESLAERPALTRVLAGIELGLGFLLAYRQFPKQSFTGRGELMLPSRRPVPV